MTTFHEGDKVRTRNGVQTMTVDCVLCNLVACLVVSSDGLKETLYHANELVLDVEEPEDNAASQH